MEDEEKLYRQKVLKIGAVSIAICLLIAYWYATQSVTADCNYSELLGVCLSIGDLHIYPPYEFYFWQQDENLKKAIPQIIGSYAAFPYLGFVLGASFTYIYAKNMKQEISHGSAAFATAKEIDETGLGNLLIAPTRSGKGVNTIIPTGLICNDFFVYEGGNDVITDYTTGQNTIKLATGTIINSSLKSSDIILNTANGSITVKNGKDKKITVTDGNGNTTTEIYGIIGGSSAETIYGGAGNDSIIGNAGNDKIYGDAGNDKLLGGEGNDSLYGGTGNDTLTGEKGNDIFVYEGGNDVITDYTAGQDKIKIDSGKITKTGYNGNAVTFTVGSGSITVQK